jgi:hypothetical protein
MNLAVDLTAPDLGPAPLARDRHSVPTGSAGTG